MIPLHKVNKPRDMTALMADLRSVIESGWVGEGPKVAEFEEHLRAIFQSPHVTAVNSGTSALTMALRLAGVGPGDEVITTPMTCMATNLPILHAGAIPVWADVEMQTGNIDYFSIKDRITPKTKAIMAVHWGGFPCRMPAIQSLAAIHDLKVIEDAAHALGSAYYQHPVGAGLSDFTCFSFQAIKHIHTGDGGAIVCGSVMNGEKDHQRARCMKWFGIDRDNRKVNELGYASWDIEEAGYKFQMNDIAATIGLSQLPDLAKIVKARCLNAWRYDQEFKGLSRVWCLKPSKWDEDYRSSYWLYTLLVDDQRAFIKFMRDHGVECSIVHERNDQRPIFAPYVRHDLPKLDEFAAHMVCIPVGQWLSEGQVSKIIEAVRSEAW